MLDGGDGGKGEEAVESLFTFSPGVALIGQRSSTKSPFSDSGGVTTPENRCMPAIFDIANS